MSLRDRLMGGAYWAPADEGGGGAAEGGSGGGAAGGGEQGSSGPDQSAAVPAWAREMINAQGQTATALQQIVQLAQQSQQPTQSTTDDDDDDDGGSPQDLELLSRADFAKHIVKTVEKVVNKNVVEPLTQQLQALQANTTRSELTGAVKELRAAHKDFDEWKGEMLSLAKEHPGLPPNRLYKLARAENPDKAAKLDKANAPPIEAPSRPRGFGGLTPNQSGTGSRARNMPGKDAATAAWQDLAAAFGEPDFGEE